MTRDFEYTLNDGAAWLRGSYIGPRLAVVYDRESATLLKHGAADEVEAYWKQARALYSGAGHQDMANDLVCVNFDVGVVGVAWLNAAIACSGSIKRYIAEVLRQSGEEAPAGVL